MDDFGMHDPGFDMPTSIPFGSDHPLDQALGWDQMHQEQAFTEQMQMRNLQDVLSTQQMFDLQEMLRTQDMLTAQQTQDLAATLDAQQMRVLEETFTAQRVHSAQRRYGRPLPGRDDYYLEPGTRRLPRLGRQLRVETKRMAFRQLPTLDAVTRGTREQLLASVEQLADVLFDEYGRFRDVETSDCARVVHRALARHVKALLRKANQQRRDLEWCSKALHASIRKMEDRQHHVPTRTRMMRRNPRPGVPQADGSVVQERLAAMRSELEAVGLKLQECVDVLEAGRAWLPTVGELDIALATGVRERLTGRRSHKRFV